MTIINKRFITAIATGAVLINALAPMAFAETITVSGNGEQSSNQVGVSTNNTTQVNQTNNAVISNHVDSSSSTGGNTSNGNTGGNTSITTGNATTNTTVTNAANVNKANVNCGCNTSGVDVNVTGNGEKSQNGVEVGTSNNVFVSQANTAAFTNAVKAKASTGNNDATSNTGGNTSINTGDAMSSVAVENAANANVATVGKGGNGMPGGSSVTIADNGEHSHNSVGLEQGSAVVLEQGNNAEILNTVDADASSGHNSANGNTHGGVSITTGDATTNVTVDNAANFNAANLDCGCVSDGLGVDIFQNGEDSLNKVTADTHNVVAPDQGNDVGFLNDVDGNSKTGSNNSISNTGGNSNPGVTTGDGSSNNSVNNVGNVNTVGNLGGFTIGTTIDFGGLWALVHGLFA